eukprot:1161482-Pelagomonas_calceolata.AAC.1
MHMVMDGLGDGCFHDTHTHTGGAEPGEAHPLPSILHHGGGVHLLHAHCRTHKQLACCGVSSPALQLGSCALTLLTSVQLVAIKHRLLRGSRLKGHAPKKQAELRQAHLSCFLACTLCRALSNMSILGQARVQSSWPPWPSMFGRLSDSGECPNVPNEQSVEIVLGKG